MANHPIALAYEAQRYVPTKTYRTGGRRKMHNPIRTAPALIQAMSHLGEQGLSLPEARRRAKRAVQEPEAMAYLDKLGWAELLDFLDTIAVFLKAQPQGKKGKKMKEFNLQPTLTRLSRAEIGNKAIDLAQQIERDGKVNKNKLKSLGGHLSAARDHWEALASLARFYPRKEIPKTYINELVALLGKSELSSFKQVAAQSIIFYEASKADEAQKAKQE